MKCNGGILKFTFMQEVAHGKIKGYQKRYQKEGDQNAQGKETGKERKETGEIGNEDALRMKKLEGFQIAVS